MAEQLCAWFAVRIRNLDQADIADKLELLLCAAELELRSAVITAAVSRLEHESALANDGASALIVGFLRHLVLTKFQVGAEATGRFIAHWINEER
jgi:hypothetical protein